MMHAAQPARSVLIVEDERIVANRAGAGGAPLIRLRNIHQAGCARTWQRSGHMQQSCFLPCPSGASAQGISSSREPLPGGRP